MGIKNKAHASVCAYWPKNVVRLKSVQTHYTSEQSGVDSFTVSGIDFLLRVG